MGAITKLGLLIVSCNLLVSSCIAGRSDTASNFQSQDFQTNMQDMITNSRIVQENSTWNHQDPCDFQSISMGGNNGLVALVTQCDPLSTSMICSPGALCECMDPKAILLADEYKAVREAVLGNNSQIPAELTQFAPQQYDKTVEECVAGKGSMCTRKPIVLHPELGKLNIQCIDNLECAQIPNWENFNLPIGKCSSSATVASFSVIIVSTMILAFCP